MTPSRGTLRTLLCIAGLALLFLCVCQSMATAAQEGDSTRVTLDASGFDPRMGERIDSAVARKIAEGDLPGCVVVVGRRDGIAFLKAYGDRLVEPEKVPMTTDTVFDLASLTKPIATATSIMLLVERGDIRLQDKVSKFFPEFAAHEKESITIEQLLVHSAGLIPDNPLDDYEHGWDSAAGKIFDLETQSTPGKRFRYSDVGFILLGKIVEEVTGKSVAEFSKERIFEPLGMKESGFRPADKLRNRAAPTEKRDGSWIQGEVHDPRAWLMDGVAGHAGLFSTGEDLSRYAQMMLNLGRCEDARILGAATVREMTKARDIDGQRRSLGWDNSSAYSRNRGETMSALAYGHGGFTGTAIWIDPELDLFVIFLSSRLYPDGRGEVNDLAGRIGTIAASALTNGTERNKTRDIVSTSVKVRSSGSATHQASTPVKLGIDVLREDGFAHLAGKRVGLITNHTGLDSHGTSSVTLLHQAPEVKLSAIFSPEHGFLGKLDEDGIGDSIHEATGVPIYSLYGKTRKPTPEQLSELDVVVFDIQDVGARFYTYTSTMGLAMEAAAENGKEFIVLDRPNPINGICVEGPLLDEGSESFVGYHRIPVRHGMTLGELARMFAAERDLDIELTVVEMKGWRRRDYLFDTGLAWTNPSPNMRSLPAALLYPGIGLLETTNISVGRGTDAPFEIMGAPWIDGKALAARVNEAGIPGIESVAIRFTPTSSKFAGEECGGLRFVITDWHSFPSLEFGLVIACALQEMYVEQWESKSYIRLLGNRQVLDAIVGAQSAPEIMKAVEPQVEEFRSRRRPYEIYQ